MTTPQHPASALITFETPGRVKLRFADLKNRDMSVKVAGMSLSDVVKLHTPDVTQEEAETLAAVVERPERVQETRDVIIANIDALRAPKK